MARLRQLERRLTNGRITPMEFIDKNTHSADGVIQQAIDARRRRRNEELANPANPTLNSLFSLFYFIKIQN